MRLIEVTIKRSPSPDSSASQSIQLELVLERLRRLEETVDRQQPAVSFPDASLEELSSRLDNLERIVSNQAADPLAEVDKMRTALTETTEKRLRESEERLHAMLSDGIEKISVVLRKLVAVQKSLAGR